MAGRQTRRRKAADEVSRKAVWRSAFAHLPPVQLEVEEGVFREFHDYVAMALGYVDAVIEGKVLENELIILAAKRFRAMYDAAVGLKRTYRWGGKDHEVDFYWSDEHVADVCSFLEDLPQTQGGEAGDRIILEPWQIWITAAIFGFRRNAGNRSVRYVDEALVDVPRKSGKSTWAAGINLFCFLFEEEVGSEIYIGASTSKQARKVFGPIRSILLREKDLVEAHGLKVTTKGVRKPDGGFIEIISSIGRKEDGHNPHVAQLDELHAIPTALHEVMDSSRGARESQLFLKTTTAGVTAGGVAYDQRKRSERVLRGTEMAPTFFIAIYTVDEEDQRDPLTWRNVVKSNPMLGITVAEQRVRAAIEQARHDPKARGEFCTKRLNFYSHGTHHALSPVQWDSCEDKALSIEQFFGQEVDVGVDLSSHDDQTAIALLFERDGIPVAFVEHFLPEASPAFLETNMADQLAAWVEEEWLTVTDGPIIDMDLIQSRIEWVCEHFQVKSIVFDRAHSVHMVSQLLKKGHPAGQISANAIEMSDPTKDIVIRARHGKLRHNGNPVLKWNALNTCLRPGELWRPVKDKTASFAKIDGFSALIHANVARMGRLAVKTPKEEKPKPKFRIRSLNS